jgi:hypothetical protein
MVGVGGSALADTDGVGRLDYLPTFAATNSFTYRYARR